MTIPSLHRAAAASVLLAAFAAFALPALAQPKLSAQPAAPAYGQPVEIQLQDVNAVLRVTRYARAGNTIVIDAETLASSFGPFGPDVGQARVSLGELPPGNYAVEARLADLAGGTGTRTVTTNLPVVPPQEWGAYVLPREPLAFSEGHVVLKSAAYLDPASLRASLQENVVRVDFAYYADAPASGPAPAGAQAYASVPLPGLAPGTYRIEAWGTPKAGGDAERYFTRDFAVAAAVPVIEFYSSVLDHYFMAAGADEIALLDRGGQGDWKRTGLGFKAWFRAADAPPGAQPVCRFYAYGPNSHFYTGSASECEELKALERAQRADAAARGEAFLGWGYEGIAFWTVMPAGGQCPAGMAPVFRLYNGRAREMDSNHRFTPDSTQRTATAVGWIDEGVHLCSPA